MIITYRPLVDRLLEQGDDADWNEFWALYSPPVLAYARSRGLTQTQDCEEVLQETMIKLTQGRLLKFDPAKARFTQTLMQIAKCATIDALRRNERRIKRHGGTVALSTVAPGLSPDRLAQVRAELALVEAILERLVERRIFTGRTVEMFMAAMGSEARSKEVAALFNTTPGNVDQAKRVVRMRLRAIRQRLDEGMDIAAAIEASPQH